MDIQLGRLSALREMQVLMILNEESPLHFKEIDARRIQSGSLTVILDDLADYGLVNYLNDDTIIPIFAIAQITDKGRQFIQEQEEICG